MDYSIRAQLLTKVQDTSVKAAFDTIERGLGSSILSVSYRVKGHVRSVNFRTRGWYPFSFIPNQTDLLFYIRNPALNLNRGLYRLALENHPGRVNVDRRGNPAINGANETKIRIRSDNDAKTLVKWLGPLVEPMYRQL